MDFNDVRSTASSVIKSVSSFVGKEVCHLCRRAVADGASLHSCKFCGKVVCNQHSTRKKDLSEQVRQARICDKCHKDVISAEIRGEHKADVKRLRRELEDVLEEVSRRSEDFDQKSALVTAKRSELSSLTVHRSSQLTALSSDLENVQLQSASLRSSVSQTKDAVRLFQLSLHATGKKAGEKQAEISALVHDNEVIAGQIPEIEEKVRMQRRIAAQYIGLPRANRTLCGKCRVKLEKKLMAKVINGPKERTGGLHHKFCEGCACM